MVRAQAAEGVCLSARRAVAHRACGSSRDDERGGGGCGGDAACLAPDLLQGERLFKVDCPLWCHGFLTHNESAAQVSSQVAAAQHLPRHSVSGAVGRLGPVWDHDDVLVIVVPREHRLFCSNDRSSCWCGSGVL